ncbi:MAG: hypothetical protein HYW86_04690 [Candidatus Roizmanbacteria bacterium]|nr:MAG: hypothetical protein HYW86_04690 [Candidatus Roizmanbacteria bacterium]
MVDKNESSGNSIITPAQEATSQSVVKIDGGKPKPGINISNNLDPRDNLSSIADNPRTVEELMKDPNIKFALDKAGIDDPRSLSTYDFETGEMKIVSLSPAEILEIVSEQNPNGFKLDKPPKENPEQMLSWLKWRNTDLTYSKDITPKMVAKGISVVTKLGLPIEELSEAQIVMCQDMTDEQVKQLRQQRETARPDFFETIRNTPGILTEEEIGNLNRQARDYIRERKLEDDYFIPNELSQFRNQLSVDIGERFDAHGLAKGDELRILNYLLSHGISPERPFHTCPLRAENEVDIAALGAVGPYDNGAFIVLGDVDRLIDDSGIRSVLVNEQYYNAVPLLQQKFPKIDFIKASEMTTALSQLIKNKAERI